MIHQQIKELFFSSVEHIVSDISQYAVHPDSDFKRSKKIPAQKLISFLVSQGSSSTRVEMLFGKLWAAMQGLAQQPGQQRDKGHANQGNAAARDQLFHALALAAGVILSVALQQVDAAPDTQGTAQTDHDGLQSIDCAVEKFHKVLTFCRLFCGTQK